MSGTFTSDAKAMQKTIAVFDIADAENDSLTLTITEQPQWLSFELSNNNQVTMTIEPDFFDINNYELALTLSDGKASSQYKLIVDVVDNPAQWQHVEITKQDLIGTWATGKNDGLSFTFFENSKGLFFVDNKLVPYNWEIDGTILMELREPGCTLYCVGSGDVEVGLLAHDGNKLRVEIQVEDGLRQYVNLTKSVPNSVSQKRFISLPQIEYNQISVVDAENSNAKIGFKTIEIQLGQTTQSRSFELEGTLTDRQSHFDMNLTSSNKMFEDLYGRFFNFKTGREDSLYFDILIDDIDIQNAAFGMVIVKVEYHAELLTDIGTDDHVVYQGLDVALGANFSYEILQGVMPTNAPTMVIGTEYSARLLASAPIDIEGTEYKAGASVFKFSNETDGETILKIPGKNSSVSKDFKWAVEDNKLEVTIDGATKNHQFYTLPEGNIGLSLDFEIDGVVTSTSIYEFNAVTESDVKIEQYIGEFIKPYLSVFSLSQELNLKFDENGRGSTNYSVGSELYNYWKFEEDKSISIISSFDCPNAFDSGLGFDACFEEAKGENDFYLINYKLLSIVEDTYMFQYSVWSKYSNQDWAFQSIRRFKKLTE
jgi:hypothetical protein